MIIVSPTYDISAGPKKIISFWCKKGLKKIKIKPQYYIIKDNEKDNLINIMCSNQIQDVLLGVEILKKSHLDNNYHYVIDNLLKSGKWNLDSNFILKRHMAL